MAAPSVWLARLCALEEENTEHGNQRFQRMPKARMNGHEVVDRWQGEKGEREEPSAINAAMEGQQQA